MNNFTNPLDHIKIASPCAADWNKMLGDERKRFCSDCKLNVYNLSAMTKTEAENLLINSENRLCVRFYRRTDGTILTKNCPVGLARLKQRVSRIAAAAFSMSIGFFGGIYSFNFLKPADKTDVNTVVIEPVSQSQKVSKTEDKKNKPSFGGAVSNSNELIEMIFSNRR